MKRACSRFSRHVAQATVASLAAASGSNAYCHTTVLNTPGLPLSLRQFSLGGFYHEYENVLGTSMELVIHAQHPLEAKECEWRVLAEIERLRSILSTYDPASEIRRVMAGAPVASTELTNLLAAYALWFDRTEGAINVNLGEVLRLWKTAPLANHPPTMAALRAAATTPLAYNVDALGKGYIIDRAVEIARQWAPTGLLNIGGDIRVWGRNSWLIGVANPNQSAENAPLLTQFHLQEGAVATSGGYARNFTIADHVYSHVIDPRTQHPTDHSLSATVVAPDCVTANALATAACVLDSGDGAQLAQKWGGREYLMVASHGAVYRSNAFLALTAAAPAAPITVTPAPASTLGAINSSSEKSAVATPAMAWPKDFQVTINLSLKTPPAAGNRGAKRPYVAIWIENVDKKHVRTIAVWGNNERWMPQLADWWNVSADADLDTIKSVTRATRPAGQYSIIWDGLDDHGKKVPSGDYQVFVEINREHGRHATESAELHCAATAQTASIRETSESDVTKITYGPPAPVEKTTPSEKK